jgi:hypothetical protein
MSRLFLTRNLEGGNAWTGTNCTGGPMSANLPLEECEAWQDLFDATGGSGWSNCKASRTDPCGCDMGVPWAACGGQGGGLCCKRSAEPPGPGTLISR